MEGGEEEEGIRSCTKVCVGGEGVTEETKSERGRSVNENPRPKSGYKMTTGPNRRSGREGKKDKERNELLPRERKY